MNQTALAPHRGTVILVLGILSLVVCGLLGPVAWIMGNTDLKEMKEGRMDPTGEGTTKAGKICGIIATVLIIVGVAIALLVVILGAIAAAASST